jgi:alanyl-tRNA synthetase
MRRAMRHAHLLGAEEPMMHRLVGALVSRMGQAYPELVRAQALIVEALRLEETRFKTTLERGLGLLEDELERLPDGADLPGEAAFRLYDTYGFPLDLTQDALRERGRGVDAAGFESAMAEQRARARAAWSGSGEAADAAIWFDLREEIGATEFLGYETVEAEGVIRALIVNGQRVGSAQAGAKGQLIANQTPFYAEAGGQVGDAGLVRTATGLARVADVKKRAGDLSVHEIEVVEGELVQGEAAAFAVDAARRGAISANHSATHLLHEALRGALGDHVAQRGSLVAPDRLRFDFAHAKPMSADELARVEAEVNAYVRQNAPVTTRIMSPEAAQETGARALFGEKYGAEVRVVSMGVRPSGETGPAGATYSLELCGGVHVRQTGEIGLMKVIGESASAAGVRRIEALTGAAALAHVDAAEGRLREVAGVLRTSPEEAPARVAALVEERRKLAAEVADLRRRIALGGGGGTEAAPEVREIAGVRFLGQVLSGVSPKNLREIVDARKGELGSGVVVLIAEADGKAAVAAGVTADLTARVSAVDLARAAAEAMGGKGGGGRPDLAQAGGADPAKAREAIDAAAAVVGR